MKKQIFVLVICKTKNTLKRKFFIIKRRYLHANSCRYYVMKGKYYYKTLLKRGAWMNDVFPNLYSLRIAKKREDGVPHVEKPKQNKILDATNLFVYVLLGNFLSFKAFMQNLRYRKQQNTKYLFETIITKGSSVYNSERYRDIEAKYDSKDLFRR